MKLTLCDILDEFIEALISFNNINQFGKQVLKETWTIHQYTHQIKLLSRSISDIIQYCKLDNLGPTTFHEVEKRLFIAIEYLYIIFKYNQFRDPSYRKVIVQAQKLINIIFKEIKSAHWDEGALTHFYDNSEVKPDHLTIPWYMYQSKQNHDAIRALQDLHLYQQTA